MAAAGPRLGVLSLLSLLVYFFFGAFERTAAAELPQLESEWLQQVLRSVYSVYSVY